MYAGVQSALRLAAIAFVAAAAITMAVGSASARSWLNIDESEGTVEGWRLGYSKGFAGCVAYARFTDKTTVWFGHSMKQSYFIAMTNPNWQALKSGTNYRLNFIMRGYGDWNGQFLAFERGNEKGIFLSNLKRKFMVQFAKAPGFKVLASRTKMAGLSLKGSYQALLAVVRCFDARRSQAERDVEEARRQQQAQPRNTAPRTASTSPQPQPAPQPRSSSGTGFMVSQKGHVVTNNHVVKGCASIKVGYSGGVLEKATLLAADRRNDLALLITDLKPIAVPGLKSRVRVGENVYVYGFPLSGLLSKTGNFTVGYITSAAGLGDDTSQLQISAPIQPGNSGGPLVDRNGNVVGIIVSKLNVLRLAPQIKDVPQNVNFAIKASIAASFLEANGIVAPSALSEKQMEPADIAANSKGYTVRVICTR
ncbi:MAG TPA: serine protease [Hyphomicrobiaceae bacterium]|nr:serine protease [Hyphomicrobiaceae bacterium]